MRIAYLINQYPAVSHTFIRREILALERQGFEVTRISIRGWDRELVDEEDHLERSRTRYVLRDGAFALLSALTRMMLTRPIHFTRALILAWRMGRRAERPLPVHFAYLAEACRIEPWLRNAGIQHLHAHFGTNSAEVAMLVHVLGGPKWSFTVHGPTEFDKPQLIGLTQKILRSEFVVAVSSFGRSQLYRCLEYKRWPKVEVVRCGLDASFFAAPPAPAPDSHRFVCVGRLVEQKGQLLLVEAAHRLAKRGVDLELVLVGDGEMRTTIQALIARYGLQDRIRITGSVSNHQVRAEILASRALVLPSFAEGLPVVIMEAMALRRPIISTFVAGIPELVVPGEHGWLVPAGDIDALVEAMENCLDASPEMIARMGQAAYDRVRGRHDIERQVARLGELFRAEIDSRSNTIFLPT